MDLDLINEEINSPETVRVFSEPPPWIIRWGIIIVLFLLVFIVVRLNYFYYGKVIVVTMDIKHKHVVLEKEVNHVISSNNISLYYVVLEMPYLSLTHVRQGQNILVRIKGSMDKEYISVLGRLRYYPKKVQNKIRAKIEFIELVHKSSGTNLSFRPNMDVNAKINIKQKSLIDIVFNNLHN